MARRFDLLVFDWDGTLLDSAGAIVSAISAACADLGFVPPPEERARHVIGLGLKAALQYALPELGEDRYAELAERYRHHYLARDQDLQLFAGVAELIGELAADGFLLAVATGKSRYGLDRAFAASGIGSYFHASRCADECFSKPHPQMLHELLDELSVDADKALMIGDTTHDLQMASNAGVHSLAVSYGAHTAADLGRFRPLACLQDSEELGEWLRRYA